MSQRLLMRTVRAWLGVTLTLALVLPHATVRPSGAGGEHCTTVTRSHPIAPMAGTVDACSTTDCTDCSAVPCRGMTHCTMIPIAATSGSPGIDADCTGSSCSARLSAPLFSRTTSPPTPPPIPLL